MNRYNATPLFLFLALFVIGFAGCGSSDGNKTASGLNGPPAGSNCTVHFRRDYMGVASEGPISIGTNGYNGANITLGGEVIRVDDTWLVLKVGDNNREWIPREAILHITVFNN